MYTFLYTDDLGYDWPGIASRVFSIGEQTGLFTVGQNVILYGCLSGSKAACLLFHPVYKLNMWKMHRNSQQHCWRLSYFSILVPIFVGSCFSPVSCSVEVPSLILEPLVHGLLHYFIIHTVFTFHSFIIYFCLPWNLHRYRTSQCQNSCIAIVHSKITINTDYIKW